jgi:hypothetical protein
MPNGTYNISVRIPNGSGAPKPVVPASINYNIYSEGGTTPKITSNNVDQNYDQGTWKLVKQGVTVTKASSGIDPVRVTLGDKGFSLEQYVILLDAVRFCK